MEKFAEVLKIFIEKHLLPSVISVTGAIATLLLIPEDNYIIQKLGKLLFIILSFCIYFLLVQCSLKIADWIRKALYSIQQKKYVAKRLEEENQNKIKEIHEFVDRLDPEDKDLLLGFIKNGNKILLDVPGNFKSGGLLQNTKIMNTSEYKGELSNIDRSYYWLTKALETTALEITANDDEHSIYYLKQYKIRDEIFHDLELIYKTERKLGNF